MTWNYRVIRTDWIDPTTKVVEPTFEIHRCYYEKDTDDVPVKWGQQPATVEGSSVLELRQDLERFMSALEKPVLTEKRGKLVEAK